MKRQSRKLGLTLAGATAIVLALSATAWACTPQVHSFSVQTAAATKSGPAGTSVTARGYCKVSGNAACPSGVTVNLWQDVTPSTQMKAAIGHQEFCRAEAPLADQDIGDVTFDAAGDITSGSGTIAARQPGPYIICTGNIDDVTSIMWDNFTVT